MDLKKYFLISILYLNLTGCLEPPQDVLKIGSNLWIGYEPLYLARNLGYLSPKKVRIVDYQSTTESMLAFRNNLIDGLMISLNEAITLLPFIPDLRAILILDVSDGGDALITQSHITELNQLKGKTIGGENTILSQFLLQKILNKAGLSLHDVKFISLTWDKHETAFLSKQVDGVISADPILSYLVEKGGINLFNSRHISEQILDILVVREDVLQNRKADWKMVAEAWFKGLNFLEKQQPEMALKYIAERKNTTPELILNMIKGVRFPNLDQNYYFLGGGLPILQQRTEAMADWMAYYGYVPQQIPNNSISSLASIDALSELIP